jgi:hypothetical protein
MQAPVIQPALDRMPVQTPSFAPLSSGRGDIASDGEAQAPRSGAAGVLGERRPHGVDGDAEL